MNAPTLWQQLLIAALGIASIPYVIALLAKIRLLPLTIYLLSVNSFTTWAAEHRILCIVLFALSVLYPILTVIAKIRVWRREEIEARNYLLRTARPLSRVPAYDTDIDW